MIGLRRRAGSAADRTDLPKGAILALCGLILVLPAALALGHGPYVDSQDRWIHHHTNNYTTCNNINENAGLRDRATEARKNWMSLDNSPEGSYYGLDAVWLPNQADCHPIWGGDDPSRIQLIDGSYGNTGWRASALSDQDPGANAGYHRTHTHIHFNLSVNWSDYTTYDRRAIVCREVGRVLGVDRVPSSEWAAHGQNNDCMSFDGAPLNQVSGGENPSNYTYTDRPGAHSKSFLDGSYADHSPTVDLDGSLVDASESESALTKEAYGISVHAEDGTFGAPSPGIVDIEIRVDNDLVFSDSQTCAQGNCPFDAEWTLEPDDYEEGFHSVEVMAVDSLGLTATAGLEVEVERNGGFAAPRGKRLTYEGCLTGESESAPPCGGIASVSAGGVNSGLDDVAALAMSPDGASVYAVAGADDAIAHLTRNPSTGALTYVGCLSGETQSTGGNRCAAIGSASSSGANSGLDGASGVAVSPDGTSVYAVAKDDDAIARFTRNPATGALTYAGCLTGETQSASCNQINSATSSGANSGLDGASRVAVSPDGVTVYAVAKDDDAVALFTRNLSSGALVYAGCHSGETQSIGGYRCAGISSAATDGTSSGLDGASGLAVRPDGSAVYVVAKDDDAIARFTRNPSTGGLTYAGCVSGETQSTGGSKCTGVVGATSGGVASGLDSLVGVAVTADGSGVYAVSAEDDALVHFAVDESGGLHWRECFTGEVGAGQPILGVETESGVVCEELPQSSASGAGSALNEPVQVVVSEGVGPVYVVSKLGDLVAVFQRDAHGGETDYASCITADVASGPDGSSACGTFGPSTTGGVSSGMDGVSAVAASPDGSSLYLGSTADDAIARFGAHTPSVGPSSGLTYAGCSTGDALTGDDGIESCESVPSASESEFGDDSGLGRLGSLAVSSDGGFVYAASVSDDAVVGFEETGSPTLDYLTCVTGEVESGTSGTDACDETPTAASGGSASGLGDLSAVVTSADGDAVYAAAPGDDAIVEFGTPTGGPVYGGCLSGDTASGPGGSAACVAAPGAASAGSDSGLDGLSELAMSPDGASVYAVAGDDDAVSHFSRNSSTNELTWVGCVSGEPLSQAGQECDPVSSAAPDGNESALNYMNSLAVSADGKSVYATALDDDALAEFDRNPTTGELDFAGCVTGNLGVGPSSGPAACDSVQTATATGSRSGFDGLSDVGVSADGLSAYAVASGDDALLTFTRDPTTGDLTFSACFTGDLSNGSNGSDACSQVPSATANGEESGFDRLSGVAVSPDGANVMATSFGDSSVLTFERNLTTGELTYGGCITGELESGRERSGACDLTPAATPGGGLSGIGNVTSIALAPDGSSAYTSSSLDATVARIELEDTP